MGKNTNAHQPQTNETITMTRRREIERLRLRCASYYQIAVSLNEKNDLEEQRMRENGATDEEIKAFRKGIGKKISKSFVHKECQAILAPIKKELRTIALENYLLDIHRFDSLQMPLTPKISSGDPEAVKAALAVMKARARHLNYDSPVKLFIEDDDPRRALSELTGIPLDELPEPVADLQSVKK